jgi:hypothetical protein
MKNAISIIVVFFLFTTSYSQSNTPAVINSSGGSSQSGYYHFEWSVGEISLVNQMNSLNNSLIVTNGFFQPYLLYPGRFNLSYQFGNDEIKIFPNPASDYVEIDFFTSQKGKVKVSFYDVSGRMVFYKESFCNGVDLIEKIPVNQFASGSYALKIDLDADADFVSKHGLYKIVKIK